MTQTDIQQSPPAKRSFLPILVGVVLMLGLGGGGFWAAYTGLIPGLSQGEKKAEYKEEAQLTGFVALDPLIISVGRDGSRHLRFTAQIEAPTGNLSQVESLKPRIADVLNSYLRALDPTEVTDPNALIRLRTQMLRRVRIVTGDTPITDLLISEFVLS